MIPAKNIDLLADFEIEDEPSLTYLLNLEQECITGTADGTKAVQQAVLKILNTERFVYPIYSWNYGVLLHDLVGKSLPYVMSEVKKRITDALLTDDRIEAITDFTVRRAKSKNVLLASFTVETVFGAELEFEQEVAV